MVCSLVQAVLELVITGNRYADRYGSEKRTFPVRMGLGLTRNVLAPGVAAAAGFLTATTVNTNNRSIVIGSYVAWALAGSTAAILAYIEYRKKKAEEYDSF